MRKGLWSPDEDERLVRCITKYVHGSWSDIARKAGLDRCGKSCRRRWMNHLRPDLKRGRFSMEEINLIIHLQEVLGNRWSDIASHLEGRTDNDVKNLWNTKIKKRLPQLKQQITASLPDANLNTVLMEAKLKCRSDQNEDVIALSQDGDLPLRSMLMEESSTSNGQHNFDPDDHIAWSNHMPASTQNFTSATSNSDASSRAVCVISNCASKAYNDAWIVEQLCQSAIKAGAYWRSDSHIETMNPVTLMQTLDLNRLIPAGDQMLPLEPIESLIYQDATLSSHEHGTTISASAGYYSGCDHQCTIVNMRANELNASQAQYNHNGTRGQTPLLDLRYAMVQEDSAVNGNYLNDASQQQSCINNALLDFHDPALGITLDHYRPNNLLNLILEYGNQTMAETSHQYETRCNLTNINEF